jgi:hypothetical protein
MADLFVPQQSKESGPAKGIGSRAALPEVKPASDFDFCRASLGRFIPHMRRDCPPADTIANNLR